MTETLYCARIFNEHGSLDFLSRNYPSREEAIDEIRRKRRGAKRCMTSEARWNEELKDTVPTHVSIMWHDV